MSSEMPHEIVLEAAEKYGKLTESTKKELAELRSLDDDSPTRAAAAVALRIDGHGYSEIAKILGYPNAQITRRVIENTVADNAGSPEEIDHIRWIASRRLERLLQGAWTIANNPEDPRQLEYAKFVVTLIDRHLRLHGADAPQQMKVIVTPSQTEIEAWVSRMARQVAGAIDEADISEGEVVEDSGEADI